jgi:hypothetical protein
VLVYRRGGAPEGGIFAVVLHAGLDLAEDVQLFLFCDNIGDVNC